MAVDPQRRRILWLCLAALTACTPVNDEALPGQTEWDRISLPAEASERVLEVLVTEGQQVAAGDLLARLDPTRADLRLAGSRADLQQSEARLRELLHGARVETLDASRAALSRAESVLAEAQRELQRVQELRQRQLVAAAELDRASSARQRATAELQVTRAQLAELSHGAREEQLQQAEAAVAAARSAVAEAQLNRRRLDLHAPRDGRIDALPFKPGDQPPVGATLASLLVGPAPYVRVFVPASRRAALRTGDRFTVTVQGLAGEFAGHLRKVASEPSFTPYFALAGDDASRLVYRGEIQLDDARALDLPAGLPVRVLAVQGDVR